MRSIPKNYEELHRDYSKVIEGEICKYAGGIDFEDLGQHVWMRFLATDILEWYRIKSSVGQAGSFRSYLAFVIHHESLNWLRAQKRSERHAQKLASNPEVTVGNQPYSPDFPVTLIQEKLEEINREDRERKIRKSAQDRARRVAHRRAQRKAQERIRAKKALACSFHNILRVA